MPRSVQPRQIPAEFRQFRADPVGIVGLRNQREVAPHADIGGVILSRAVDYDIDLIVMGIYGHSRLREMVLGGASRTLLSSMTVPVFMAH